MRFCLVISHNSSWRAGGEGDKVPASFHSRTFGEGFNMDASNPAMARARGLSKPAVTFLYYFILFIIIIFTLTDGGKGVRIGGYNFRDAGHAHHSHRIARGALRAALQEGIHRCQPPRRRGRSPQHARSVRHRAAEQQHPSSIEIDMNARFQTGCLSRRQRVACRRRRAGSPGPGKRKRLQRYPARSTTRDAQDWETA